MDERAKAYLENVGFDVEGDIYSNYDTQEKRDAKIKIFVILIHLKKQE